MRSKRNTNEAAQGAGAREATRRKPLTVIAEFQVLYVVHPSRKKFQSDGHFLAGLKDNRGERREWRGREVHVLTLGHKEEHVLTIMSDSLADVKRLMGEEIARHFFAMFTADYNRQFTYDAFQAVNAERNKLKDYLIGKGEEETVRALLGGAISLAKTEPQEVA